MITILNQYLEYDLIYVISGLFIFTVIITSTLALIEFKILKLNLNDYDDDESDKKSTLRQVVLMCLLGPYLETLIFQTIIFNVISFFFKDVSLALNLSILTSTTIFSLAHILLGNIFDAIRRVPLGLALALVYSLLLLNGESISPTKGAFLFHAIWNGILVLVIPSLALLGDKFLNIISQFSKKKRQS